MSNTPSSATTGTPDLEAEELAAKQNISVEEAKQIIAEEGHDRGSKDGAAQQMKLDQADAESDDNYHRVRLASDDPNMPMVMRRSIGTP